MGLHLAEFMESLNRKCKYAAVGLFSTLTIAITAYGQDYTAIFNQYRNSVVSISIVATTSTGGVVALPHGTGFIVSADGHVLTARHLLDPQIQQGQPATQIDSYDVKGAVGSISASPLKLEIVDQLPNVDLLLLKLPDMGQPWLPVPVCRSAAMSVGMRLVHVGFPLNLDAGLVSGDLSSKNGPAGMWQTSLSLNYGNSGGPVFNTDGFVVGVVYGGYGYSAPGINFFRPIQYASALLADALAQDRCSPATLASAVETTTKISASQSPDHVVANIGPFSFGGGFSNAEGASWIRGNDSNVKLNVRSANPIDHEFSFEQADHTLGVSEKLVTASFVATTGSRIARVDMVTLSSNNASDVAYTVSPDGSTVTVHAKLRSGPIFDQWRGWLNGVLKTVEVAK